MFAVQYNFFGSVSHDAMHAADIVASAMEAHQLCDFKDAGVIAMALEILGDTWDKKSLFAVLDGCSFEAIEASHV